MGSRLTAIVTTPQGIISRYLGGILFDPKDVKLALNEATEGKIGSFVDKMLLYCFHYNPKRKQILTRCINLVRIGRGCDRFNFNVIAFTLLAAKT